VKEFLSEKDVDYVEYNVQDDEEARERMIEISQHTTVPTLVIDGEVMVGIFPERLAELLQ
jgi:glutaredoxin